MGAQRAKVVSGGRLQLPADLRRTLSLADGDTVLMEIVGDELHVRPLRDAVQRVRSRLQQYIPAGVSLSEELIADRRAVADRE